MPAKRSRPEKQRPTTAAPSADGVPASQPRRWRILVPLSVFLLAGGGAGLAWLYLQKPPARIAAPLPPLTTSPFLNTAQDVPYVGDQECLNCHRVVCNDYHQHPMGRSLFHAADAPPLENYSVQAGNPFTVGPLHFQVLREGGRVLHREWCEDARGKVVAQREEAMDFAVGSGTQARSYFYQRDGFLFESPITWYSLQSRWQLSPGYEKNQQHFHRRMEMRCLYCHCQEAHPIEGTTNRYREPIFGQLAIGCERCHGPGQLHVSSRKQNIHPEGVDYTIVNPRHLAPALREAVCEQCHLQGEAIVLRRGRRQTEYRPGLPLQEYLAIFIRPAEAEDTRRIVGHVEQMYQSVCFNRSKGKFGCSSCHDPHREPAPRDKVTFYRERCRNCHTAPEKPEPGHTGVPAPDCSLSREERRAKDPQDNCLACHMPQHASSTVVHLAVTDHRVLRDPAHPPPVRATIQPGELPLRLFPGHRREANDEELPRDQALAMIPLIANAQVDRATQAADYLSRQVLPLLDQAVARDPEDLPALEGRGLALYAQRRYQEAFRVLQEVLAREPEREQALTWAAYVAESLGRYDRAEEYWRRLAQKYPQFPEYQEGLASVLVRRAAWAEALEAAQKAVKLDPFRPEIRELLIRIALERGDRARARQEYQILGVLDAAYQQTIRPRYAARLEEKE